MSLIFPPVGTQLPFDRLIDALDGWAARTPGVRVVAQIGRAARTPSHIAWMRDMTPAEFRQQVAGCDTVVAHAGMGSIITAIELGKRVIVMPRLAALGEHRNDHQLATVARLSHLRGLEVAHDADDLTRRLAGPVSSGTFAPRAADPNLISAIRQFAGLEAA